MMRLHALGSLEDSHQSVKADLVVLRPFDLEQPRQLIDIKIQNVQCELVKVKGLIQLIIAQGANSLDLVFHSAAIAEEKVGARVLGAVRRSFVFMRFLSVQEETHTSLTDLCLDVELDGLYKLLLFQGIIIGPFYPIEALNEFHEL